MANNRVDYYKNQQKGRELLKDIVAGYACNLQASLKPDGAEIDFPVYLLQDINEQLILENIENEFTVLEGHNLPKEFDFLELLKYFHPSFGRLSKLEGKYVSRIRNVEIIGKRVHLDVMVN
jgi:hypothetical protein